MDLSDSERRKAILNTSMSLTSLTCFSLQILSSLFQHEEIWKTKLPISSPEQLVQAFVLADGQQQMTRSHEIFPSQLGIGQRDEIHHDVVQDGGHVDWSSGCYFCCILAKSPFDFVNGNLNSERPHVVSVSLKRKKRNFICANYSFSLESL